MKLLDAHCHLQDPRIQADFQALRAEARAAGVEYFACAGTGEKDWAAIAQLAESNASILPLFGLHPGYVAQRSPRWEENLRGWLQKYPRAGVGEIGLDHMLKEFDAADQQRVFRRQLELAAELRRPAVMHCREAWGAIYDDLRALSPRPTLMLHSFSGGPDMVRQLRPLDVYYSFSCSLTRPDNHRAREAVRVAPADRLLIETDAPYIPPHGVARTALNRPANIVRVLEDAAGLRNMPVAELAEIIWENSCRFFGVPPAGGNMNQPAEAARAH